MLRWSVGNAALHQLHLPYHLGAATVISSSATLSQRTLERFCFLNLLNFHTNSMLHPPQTAIYHYQRLIMDAHARNTHKFTVTYTKDSKPISHTQYTSLIPFSTILVAVAPILKIFERPATDLVPLRFVLVIIWEWWHLRCFGWTGRYTRPVSRALFLFAFERMDWETGMAMGMAGAALHFCHILRYGGFYSFSTATARAWRIWEGSRWSNRNGVLTWGS